MTKEHFPDCYTNVDFCYRVYENGYYNVVRNNMYLYYFDPVSKENLETLEQREKSRPAGSMLSRSPPSASERK